MEIVMIWEATEVGWFLLVRSVLGWLHFVYFR